MRQELAGSKSATRRSFLVSVGTFVGSAAAPLVVRAQDVAKGLDDSNGRLEGMQRLAREVTLSEIKDGTPGPPVALRAEPLFRYGDPGRGIQDGTLWAWGERGRPLAVLKVELWRRGRGRWGLGVSASSRNRIMIEFKDGLAWTSRKTGLDLHTLTDAPAPADSAAQRLIQSKELARRFSAHVETHRVSGRIELRLLPKPIDRYDDPDAGLRDGLIYSFAYATNPIALLFLEAWTQQSGAPVWRYGFARHGDGEAIVLLNEKEVWTVPFVEAPVDADTYMNRSLPLGAEAR